MARFRFLAGAFFSFPFSLASSSCSGGEDDHLLLSLSLSLLLLREEGDLQHLLQLLVLVELARRDRSGRGGDEVFEEEVGGPLLLAEGGG